MVCLLLCSSLVHWQQPALQHRTRIAVGRFAHEMLKSWEWPGDEAAIIIIV